MSRTRSPRQSLPGSNRKSAPLSDDARKGGPHRSSVPGICFSLDKNTFTSSTASDNVEAQRLFRRALGSSIRRAAAYAWLSYAIVLGIKCIVEPDERRLNEAVAPLARRGVELDDQDALTHFTHGRALLARKAHDHALAELRSAGPNPNLAIVHGGLGDRRSSERHFADADGRRQKIVTGTDRASSVALLIRKR